MFCVHGLCLDKVGQVAGEVAYHTKRLGFDEGGRGGDFLLLVGRQVGR